MYRLSSILILVLAFFSLNAQSPHGEAFKVNCAACHNPNGWTINSDTLHFNHDTTKFPLVGTHLAVDCKKCHATLVFNETTSQCIDCHKDVHSMSLGNDCARCHTPQNWLVDFIPELHEQNGFPLVGNHSTLSCVDCHISETNLRFNRLGNECVNCHLDEYMATTNPDHKTNGFSTNCLECHDLFSGGWGTDLANHNFFPLVQGHDVKDCKRCHQTNNYSDASPVCASCHTNDYNSTTNPNHADANFSTECKDCHNISSWKPTNFDHSFHPLIGAHSAVANNCILCHQGNYANTPNTCVGCHTPDYNATTNPNHSDAQFPTDCKQCHNETSWVPSSFDHDIYHPLIGAHAPIANDCNKCHSGGYLNTPNTCAGCHLADYNSTTNPNHSASQFSTNCTQCHNETSWVPSSFDHDGMYFPIYSGKHKDKWNQCMECHTNSGDYSVFTCIDCHEHNNKIDADNDHTSVSGYVYGSTTCYTCHPTGLK